MKLRIALCIFSFFAFFASVSYAKDYKVIQKDKKFSTESLEIKIGDEITFRNEDETTHHIMYKVDGQKKSHQQKKGDADGTEITQKFEKEEDIVVRCAIHPKMKLEIKVRK